MKLAVTFILFLSLQAFAQTKKFAVEGMTCEGCVQAIKAKLCKSPEIQTCDVKVGSVELTFKPGNTLGDQAVIEKIKSAGYNAKVHLPAPASSSTPNTHSH